MKMQAAALGAGLLMALPFAFDECKNSFAQQRPSAERAADRGSERPRTEAPPQRATAAVPGPLRVELLESNQTPATFVLRGAPRGPGRIVFLHGMCGHALGYAQSFQ